MEVAKRQARNQPGHFANEASVVASGCRLTMWPIWVLPTVEEAAISWVLSWPGLRHRTSIEVGIVDQLGRPSEPNFSLGVDDVAHPAAPTADAPFWI